MEDAVIFLVDPWRDCERIYDAHFADRVHERSLPKDDVARAFKYGRKTMDQKNEYRVSWNGWIVKASLRQCFVFLRTAYRE